MVERASVCVLAVLVLAVSSPSGAQPDEEFAERERALARDLAAQQEAEAERERVLARELEAQQRELELQQRELEAQHAEQQRALEREFAAQQRELQAQQREFEAQQREFQQAQRELAEAQETSSRELARELAKARAELEVSAAEIARLSAQRSGRVVTVAPDFQSFVMLGQRPMLGMNVEDAAGGVRVRGVSPNGPAAAAGVAVGDRIVALDGVDLEGGTSDFLARLADIEPGEEVELRIRRGNDTRVVVVEATENTVRQAPFVSVFGEPGSAPVRLSSGHGEFIVHTFGGPWRDVELVSLTPGLGEYFGTDDGLLVVRAGNMAELGLRDGDVILEISGRQPQSPEHATRILSSFAPGEPVPLSVMRQRRREALTITLPNESFGWRSRY